MTALLVLFSDEECEEPVVDLSLGEILIPEEGDDLFEGEPRRIWAHNSGDTYLRNLEIDVVGEGAEHVVLARDEQDQPGTWASPGQPIVPYEGTLPPGEKFSFWLLGLFSASDAEATLPFALKVSAVSIVG